MKEIGHVRELLELKGSRFVAALYRTLLKREPDAAGLKFYTDRLGSGVTKEAVIAEIGGSFESRDAGVEIGGLRVLIAREKGWMRRLAMRINRRSRTEESVRAVVFQVELVLEQLADLRLQVQTAAANATDASNALWNASINARPTPAIALAPLRENFFPTATPDSLSVSKRMFTAARSVDRG